MRERPAGAPLRVAGLLGGKPLAESSAGIGDIDRGEERGGDADAGLLWEGDHDSLRSSFGVTGSGVSFSVFEEARGLLLFLMRGGELKLGS